VITELLARLGAISFDILMVGWVYVLVRWVTRRVESRVRMSDGDTQL